MTPLPLPRSTGLLARGALLALVVAGCAGTAASRDRTTAPAPARTAVLAGADATPAAVDAATGPSGGATATAVVTVRRASGALDAQAQATRLAAEGYDTIVGVGAEARAAVSQAAAAEVGDADTVWRTR
ncbi:MAG TPA: hypothetical protein VFG42_22580 [Baekduia sp.]|uniref:hypothetical protein n=1 Tax=Baekduia sp. TaxID=2600305 RepID=UPI002D765C7C|nr:hypothetical protein [Baekduia sp.]HET6509601.1 hypothetical protein [Baekduia sp.]